MNIINKITTFIENKKQEQAEYNNLLNKSTILTLDKDLVINDNNLVTYNMYEYNNMCPYTNLETTKLIDGITPLNETILYIAHINTKKDNQDYFLILTSLRIIIMNKDKYKEFNYLDITSFTQIKKSFMSQVVSINNVIISIDVNEAELTNIYNLITNINYRNNIILEKTKYLCGINPIYQNLNKIGSGISIDANNNIVFHNKKINNYVCTYDNILNYEVMEDNTPVLRKKTLEQSQAMGVTKKECYQMSLRITLSNNQIFEIIILEPSTFNSAYSHMDKTYLETLEFAKTIIAKLETFNKNIY